MLPPSKPGSVPGSTPGSCGESHFPPEVRLRLLGTEGGQIRTAHPAAAGPPAPLANSRGELRAEGTGLAALPRFAAAKSHRGLGRLGTPWCRRRYRSLRPRRPRSWASLPGTSSLSLKIVEPWRCQGGGAKMVVPGWRGHGAGSVPALGADLPCVTGRKKPPGRGMAAPGHPRGGKVTHNCCFAAHDPLQPLARSMPGTPRWWGRAAIGAAAIYSRSRNILTLKYSPAFCFPLQPRRR